MDDDDDQLHDIELAKSAPVLLQQLNSRLSILEKNSKDGLPINPHKHIQPLLSTIDQFQIAPQFLDPVLEKTVLRLANYQISGDYETDWPYEILYAIAKVRGYKVVSRFLPVKVQLLEDLVIALEQPAEHPWQRQYCLLLWLSMLILAPFSLSTFQDGIEQRIYLLTLKFLGYSGKERDSAALVMSRLITRPDTRKTLLPEFFKLASETCTAAQNDTYMLHLGILQSSAAVLLLSEFAHINPNSSDFFETLLNHAQGLSSLHRKFVVKNLGRYVLLCLASTDVEPEQIESMLGELLLYLSDNDTIVRHSASKAVARIVQKLPDVEFQEQVISAVLNNFEDDTFYNLAGLRDIQPVNDNKWHGSLLCCAEMLRRHLLVSQTHFQSLIQNILTYSLSFEQKQVSYSYSSGMKVRDASCYVCWALFRTYREIPVSALQNMLQLLVNITCYDREVTIRRAAGAAIQEGIGRHGTLLPDVAMGIELVKSVDFFRLGLRTNSYLQVSQEIYNLGFHGVVAFAIDVPVRSCYPAVRRLAASSLKKLIQNCDQNLAESCAKHLLQNFSKNDLDIEHGVLYCLGEVLNACDEPLTDTTMAEILDLLKTKITDSDLTGPNEVMYSDGFAHLWASYVKFASPQNEKQLCFLTEQKLTLTMLRRPVVGRKMVTAKDTIDHQSIMSSVVTAVSNTAPEAFNASLIRNWVENMFDNHPEFATALGALPNINKTALNKLILSSLESIVKREGRGARVTALTRVEAIKALASLLLDSGQTEDLSKYTIFLKGLDDFSISAQGGEVGSLIRIQSITTCGELWKRLKESSNETDFIKQFEEFFISRLLRMVLEVQDKVRYCAISCLITNFPYSLEPVPGIRQIERAINLQNPEQYFESVFQIWPTLNKSLYQAQFSLGIVKLCGTIYGNEGTLTGASISLVALLKDQNNSQNDLLKYFLRYLDVRQSKLGKLPGQALHVWQTILENGLELDEEISSKLIDLIILIRDIDGNRAATASRVIVILSELAIANDDHTLFEHILILLSHDSTQVRQEANEAIFSFFINSDDEKALELTELLNSVDWDHGAEEDAIRQIKQLLKEIQ